MKFALKTTVLSLLLLVSTYSFAEEQTTPEPLYQVELFIFSYNDFNKLSPESNLRLAKYQSSEAVSITPNYTDLGDFTNNSQLTLYQHLSSDKFTLNNVKIAMSRKLSITPLLHTAWLQSATTLRYTTPVRIQSEQSYLRSDELFPESGLDEANASATDLQRTSQLFGLVRLIKARNNYHTLRLNLVFASPNEELMPRLAYGNYQPMLKYFHIDQEQPIELGINRINYFDSPAFGVVANVTKIKR